MNTAARVVLTSTSISIVSGQNSLITSIPLRTWVKENGHGWSSRVRQPHEVRYLVKRLEALLEANDSQSVTKLVSAVLREEIPPAPEKRKKVSEQSKKESTSRVKPSSSSALMGGSRPSRRPKRVTTIGSGHLANPMIRPARDRRRSDLSAAA